jgi:hypothetical protein
MAAKKKKTTPAVENGARLPAEAIPEVSAYLDVQEQLMALRVDNPDVFRQFDDLVEQHNTALEAAEKVVRLKGISCGPFDNYSTKINNDADKMYEELGEELFLQCGGSVSKKTVYAVDKNRVEAAIASGKIPQECLAEFQTTARTYHIPKKIIL